MKQDMETYLRNTQKLGFKLVLSQVIRSLTHQGQQKLYEHMAQTYVKQLKEGSKIKVRDALIT